MTVSEPLSYQFSCSTPGDVTITVKFHAITVGDSVNQFVNFLLGSGFSEALIYDSLAEVLLDRVPALSTQPHQQP